MYRNIGLPVNMVTRFSALIVVFILTVKMSMNIPKQKQILALELKIKLKPYINRQRGSSWTLLLGINYWEAEAQVKHHVLDFWKKPK